MLDLRCAACSADLASEELAEASGAAVKRVEYDPGFRRAVALGFLSVRQAIERGSLQHFVTRIVERHGLSVRRALLVAYNRIPLGRAVRLERPEPQPVVAPAAGAGSARWLLRGAAALALAGTLCFGLMWREAASRDRGAAADPRAERIWSGLRWEAPGTRGDTSVRTDHRGRVIEVVASSPGAVLEAYCDALRNGARPVRIVPSDGPWIGVYRLEDGLRAVSIQRHPERRCWGVGDGLGPVAEVPVR